MKENHFEHLIKKKNEENSIKCRKKYNVILKDFLNNKFTQPNISSLNKLTLTKTKGKKLKNPSLNKINEPSIDRMYEE